MIEAMIDIQTKIHDKFSIEFKVGFSGSDDVKINHFDVNSWIFIPNSLYINKATYSKDRFYTDVKSNIRLLTPSYTLKQMVEGDDAPMQQVIDSLPDINEFEFQMKLFGSIFKSSIRNISAIIIKEKDTDAAKRLCDEFIADTQTVLKTYRMVFCMIDPKDEARLVKFRFTDEFISHQLQIQTMKVIKALQHREGMEDTAKTLIDILRKETDYKIAKGYSHVIINDELNNRELVNHHSKLKKYIESALYLNVNTTQDGQAVKQISFSLAAGLAMMVYLLITTLFQKYWGNYPNLIFFILVIFYILKDRIKELTRWMFAYQLKDRYYDNKTVISINGNHVGVMKEGMDFISEDKVPDEVMQERSRTRLEVENKLLDEKIILYRKRVEIDNDVLGNQYNYDFKGINDIIRYHINYLTKKMDNPETFIDCIDDKGEVSTITANRVYYLHIVMQFKWEDHVEYRAFHVSVNRNGILDIKTN